MLGKGNDGTGDNLGRDDWETPNFIFDKLDEQYGFIFDCCATKENSKCAMYSPNFKNVEKGLDYVFWMNPPFSLAREMFGYYFERVSKGVCIYRCDNMETRVWQDIILKNADWVFIPKGRISYSYNPDLRGGKGSRFPSAFIGIGLPPPEGWEGTTLFVKNAIDVQEKKQ